MKHPKHRAAERKPGGERSEAMLVPPETLPFTMAEVIERFRNGTALSHQQRQAPRFPGVEKAEVTGCHVPQPLQH